ADRNRSHWSTSKTPSYTKSVSWQHHQGSPHGYTSSSRKVRAGVFRQVQMVSSSHLFNIFNGKILP
ncbi:hypothetical protein RZR40_20305, partial [Escherichia coli]|uniref:hypothetical protein n=1 Tax=Escherichia coli TaxID=562 RepID=UPI00292C0E40